MRFRLMVLTNWIYSYFTYDFAVRVIHDRHRFPHPDELERDTAPDLAARV
jgi:NADH dehydrogenase